MLASLLAGLASGETAAAIRRARLAAIFYVLSAVAALCGCGFLIAAVYIWAARYYGPLHAALGFGIGFLVLAGIILLIFRLSAGSRTRQRARKRKSDVAAIGITTALAVLPTLLRGKGGLGVILAPAVALAAYAIYRENTQRGPDDPDSGPAT